MLPFGLQPLCDVAAYNAVLQLHIGPQRLPSEQCQKGLSDSLVCRAVHEGQVFGAYT